MSIVHTRAQINGLIIPNRLVRSATHEFLGDLDGRPTAKLTALWRDLSTTGLIVTGATYVMPTGRVHAHQVGIVTPSQLGALRSAIDAVHAADGRICIQLNHSGLEGPPSLSDGRMAEGPTANSPRTAAMTPCTIKNVINAFVRAGIHAHSVGADAVQLHAAHGYLLGEFISPLWNKRTDDFGGTTAKRFEIVRRILVGLRKSLPQTYPVLIKMNGHDVEPGGVTVDTAIETALLAEEAGADALEISGGSGRKPYSLLGDMPLDILFKDAKKREAMRKRFSDIKFRPMFNHSYCKAVKKAVKIPVISVGGFRSYEEINHVLLAEECDMVALSRPFIRHPKLAPFVLPGWKSSCVSCNRCFFDAQIQCVVNH
jgi:2,4-dienoyl-CoA reductase-like NADH-dependent reductase (Old Yellow Enzyme family)